VLSDLHYRLRSLFRREAMDADLHDEIRFHFEKLVEKHMSSGMTREEARRRAGVVFGGEEQMRQNCRDARGSKLAETALQDLRYALRAMRNHPSFFAVAILTLALGIGASTAVFSVVNAILLKPSPYPNAGRLEMLWRKGPIAVIPGIEEFPWSGREFKILTQTSTSFQHLAAFKKDTFNLTGSGEPMLLEGVRASGGFFASLGVQPTLGRTFTADDDQPGHDHVAVLSHRLWLTRFGADTSIAGKSIALNGTAYTVIGVMPASFVFPNQEGIPPFLDLPQETELWVPLALPPNPPGPSDMGVIAEPRAANAALVQQDFANFERRMGQQFPGYKGWTTFAVPFSRQLVADVRSPLRLLLGAVSVVLLIACANVAGLVLNRSLGRRRELTLRGALGAGRGRLIRQLMTETMLLAMAGGALGVALGEAALSLVRRFGPESIPHLRDAGLDVRVLAYAIGTTFIAAVISGLAPSLAATRMNMVEALKEGTQRAGGSATAPRMRNALLIAQMAMALVLVVAAGLLVRTFWSMLKTDAGFEAARVVTFELPLPLPKYADTARMAQLYEQVLLTLRSTAGVQSAGIVSNVPMAGAPDSTVIRIPEHPTPSGADAPYANYSFISPGYFATVGTPILRGRDFSAADTLTSMPVTMINATMARTYFPGEDPIGKQVGVGMTRIPTRTIIAIVADIKHGSLREEPAPEMFVPYTQNEIKIWPSMQAMQFAVRSKGDLAAIGDSVRQAVYAVDPELPVAKFAPLATLVDNSMTADRFSMLLVGAFGVLALVLASIGMYGVISYSVLQRTPEIGIRIALGAQRAEIFAMVLKQAALLAAAGIVVGLAAAFATTRLMMRFLYGVRPTDPITFAGVALLLLAAGLLACYLPARKAMSVDPLTALRYE